MSEGAYFWPAPQMADPCVCKRERGPCGMQEVSNEVAPLMRRYGYKVLDGLDDRLPGWWVRACALQAFQVERAMMVTP